MNTVSEARAAHPPDGSDGRLRHLHGLRLVDVCRGEVRTASITIDEGRIVGLDEPPPGSAEIVDLDGYWATPSLVDMHAHVTFEARGHEGPVAFSFDEPAQLGALRAVQNLTEAARNGICLVRDAGGRAGPLEEIKRWLAGGGLLLPELVTSGEPICLPGGHGAVFGQTLASFGALEDLLHRHIRAGHEWLKVMNGPELWPEAELEQLLSAARKVGLYTAVHAFTPEGIAAAVRAGATTVEHGMVADSRLAEEALTRGTAFVPTSYCSWISLRPRFTRSQPSSEVVLLQYWYEYLDSCNSPHLAMELPVLPGTDAGCSPCTFDDYLDELMRFERWGIDSLSVLRRATIDAAALLDRQHTFGSLEVGKWANLIVTGNDPTEGVVCLRNPALVLFKGSAVVNTLGERWP